MSRKMKKAHILQDIAMLVLILSMAMTDTVYAYIDPGSGGVLITAILGFFAAIGYTFRKWFYGLKSKLGLSKPDIDDEDDI